jgi:4-hydroxy-tetrahydrodipicolinate synthase
MQRLSKIPQIVGVKEVTANIDHLNILLDAFRDKSPAFSILSGDDPVTYSMMTSGCHGVVSVAGNLIPGKMKALVDAALEENYAEARRIHFELLPIFKALSIETNPIPVKSAMNMCGMPAGPCRLPLCGLMPENRLVMEETLKKMRLFSGAKAGIHG